MTQVLTLANGMQFDCGFFGEATIGALYLILPHTNIITVATAFGNAANLEHLVYEERDDEGVVRREERDGYRVVISINVMTDGAVRVGLRRPYVGEEL